MLAAEYFKTQPTPLAWSQRPRPCQTSSSCTATLDTLHVALATEYVTRAPDRWRLFRLPCGSLSSKVRARQPQSDTWGRELPEAGSRHRAPRSHHRGQAEDGATKPEIVRRCFVIWVRVVVFAGLMCVGARACDVMSRFPLSCVVIKSSLPK